MATGALGVLWRWPRAVEWLLVGLAAPLLLFPGQYTLLGAALILTAWPLRRAVTSSWTVPSAARVAVALMVAAAALSLLVSVRLDYSAPRFWGLVLGLAVYTSCLYTGRDWRARELLANGLLCGGTVLTMASLVFMATPAQKVLPLDAVYGLLPRLPVAVQTSTVVLDGINPNEVGGLAALLGGLGIGLVAARGPRRAIAAACAVALIGAVVLSQSRSAMVGSGVALAVAVLRLVAIPRRWLVAAIVAVMAAGLVATILPFVPGSDGATLDDDGSGAAFVLDSRLDLWQRALAMIVDMPFTGVGLNSFPVVLVQFYPSETDSSQWLTAHAHNLLLQTALDLGILGAVGFCALVAIGVRGGLRGLRRAEDRVASRALLLALLAHGVYGLTDAISLGAKPSPALFAVLGLLAATDADASGSSEGGPGAIHLRIRRLMGVVRRRSVLLSLGACTIALSIAPASVNLARLVLHRVETAGVDPPPGVAQMLRVDVEAARRAAWGPYVARAHALDALAARAARDARREIAALERASVAGPWDPSLAQQLGELHLREGDLEGVVAAWGPERTVQTLLKLGRREPPAAAFQWFALARRAAPDDPRPPAAVAATYEKAGRLDEAAQALAEACLLQARAGALRSAADAGGTGLGTIAARLLDQSAPLPPPMAVVPSQSVGRLLLQAAALLEERADLAGALYAAQLAAKAAPGSAASWGYLAGLWERLGQPQLAAEARLRAPRGSEREVRSVP